MSCLLSEEMQDGLFVMIASDMYAKTGKDTPVVINDYVNEVYEFVKKASDNEALAVDAARLVPTMLDKIIVTRPELGDLLEKHNDDIRIDIIRKIKDFKKGIEQVREHLGLNKPVTEDFGSAAEELEEKRKEPAAEIITEEKVDYNPLPDGAFRTIGPEFINYKDPDKANYLELKPEEIHNFNVQREIAKELSSQIDKDDITNSSQLKYPGVNGGAIFLKITPDNKGYRGLTSTLVDSYGEVIKFDNTGKVIDEGSPVEYRIATDPATNSKGELIIDPVELKKHLAETNANGNATAIAYELLNNINKQITDQVAARTKGELDADAKEALRQTVIKEINARYASLKKIRTYLHDNPNAFVKSVINGNYKGFVVYHIWKQTPLSAITGVGEFTMETKIQTAGSDTKVGITYFDVPGVDKPVVAIPKNIAENPEMVEKLVSLFTGNIFTDETGTSPLSIGKRVELIEQFLFTKDIKFMSNDTGGKGKNWLTSKGFYTVQIGPDKFDIKFDDSENTKKIVQLIRAKLSDPILLTTVSAKGAIVSADDKTVTEIKELAKQGAEVFRGEQGQSFEEALAKRNAEAKLTGVSAKPINFFGHARGFDKRGNPIYTYYKVQYPKFQSKESLLNKPYTDFTVTTENGVSVINEEKKPYNDYIKNNFTTSAFVSEDGTIKFINPYLAFQPTLAEVVNMAEAKKDETPVKAEPVKVEPVQVKPSVADESLDEIKAALLAKAAKRSLEKNVSQKTKDNVTAAQIAAAEEWYSKSPLAAHFPFKTLFGAVNTTENGPIAQWTVQGISLFQYFSPDGKLNKDISADATDLYHEAWHGFTQTFLTKEQRAELYAQTSRKKGSFVDYKGRNIMFKDAKPWQLEEYLAEDFRKYMLSGGTTRDKESPERNSIFRKMLDFLKQLFGKATLKDVVENPLGVNSIHELYEKLHVGDLSLYRFDISNRDESIGYLNKSMASMDGISEISLEDANLLVASVDSIISDFVNGMIDEAGNTQVINDSDDLKLVYRIVKMKLKDEVIPRLTKERDAAENEFTANKLDQNIKLIEWAIAEFGDTTDLNKNRDGKGFIAYHRMKSKFVPNEDTEDFFADIDEVAQLLNSKDNAFDKGGNELALLDRASVEVVKLLRSVHKYNEKGEPVLNRLGIHELSDFHDVANKISRITVGATTMDKMYAKLQIANDSLINELLKKLGSPNPEESKAAGANLADSMDLWLKFWKSFNLAEIRLIQMNIEKETGKATYTVKIGHANTQSRKAGTKWENDFRMNTSQFIKRNLDNSDPDFHNRTYLDVLEVLKEFGEGNKLKTGFEFDFFRAIGINLSGKKEIKNAVANSVGSATQIYNRLRLLANRTPVNTIEGPVTRMYELNDIFKEYSGSDKNPVLSHENSNYDDLRTLETRFSDYASGNMVTNAEGNTQSEQSLNNTISVIMKTLNEVDSYEELMDLPYMQHLNIATNPFAEASIWLNSLFDLDAYRKTGKGPKKKISASKNAPKVLITMSNLSGAQLITEEGDEGTSSASADEFTKMILDFHLTMAGKPELMRHADKGTSFSVWMSNLITPAGNGKNYIDTSYFAKDVIGYAAATETIMPYIKAEVKRIKLLQEMAAKKNVNYDANYIKEGQKFVIFEDVLTPELQARILKEEDFSSIHLNTPLVRDIKTEMVTYFEKQFTEAKSVMSKASFISPDLIKDTRTRLNASGISDNAINTDETKDALIRSFTVNSWIHNLESMSLIYGDIAQYNLYKEEFHKRNAGAGSSGGLINTDKNMLKYVNKSGRLYARTQGLTEKQMDLDGSYDTVLLEDNKIPSANYDELLATTKRNMLEKAEKISDPVKRAEAIASIDAKAEMAVSSYLKNDEGDGQGWITFDFYRNVSILKGTWSRKQEKLYKAIATGGYYDESNITEFFPTCKFQYWGPIQVEEGQPPLMGFHKFSLLPLIPSLIKGSNLQQLHDKMITQGIDYSIFRSGSKISTITEIRDGKSIEDKFYTDGKLHNFNAGDEHKTDKHFTKNKVYLQFLKDQLTIAPYYKNQVTFPTQMRKLIENGMMEGGIPVDFPGDTLQAKEKAWSKLTEDQRLAQSPFYRKIIAYETTIAKLTAVRMEELKKEANIEYKDGQILLTEKLRKFLIEQLKRQDFGDHEMDFIKEGPNGTIAHDFSISFSAEKLEKMLNAIVVKRLIKQKFNGEGLVQISGAGFESSELRGELTKEEWKKYGSNGLPFYHEGTNGKTRAMKVKISLQGDFVNLLHLQHTDKSKIGTRERLNEMLKSEAWLATENNRKMVTIIGPRIPVQGLNSMEFAEVYEFLPAEAGNIVILPTEIVAKSGSDFDIDKLTFMMPNILSGVSYEYWSTPAATESIAKLQEQYSELDFSVENIASIIEKRKSRELTLEEQAVLTLLKKHGDKNVSYAEGENAAGLENSILDMMRGILEMKENFVDLVRANGTEIVKENLADDLASDVMDFNPKTVSYVDDKGKTQKRISGTRVLEMRYNLYKHSSNNIGKQTLGLGAVDNTYNSLFNRIGARMSHKYSHDTVQKRIDILLPHNKLKDEFNEDVISLSHILDAQGNNSIADVISQLMNGWVDIAKDAWIFNLQGNKEVTPTLMFMIQSGVPIKQAVYLVSNPMVRAYIDEQKMASSTFAQALDKNVEYKGDIAKTILTGAKYGINLDINALNNKVKFTEAVYNKTLDLTSRGDKQRPDGTQLSFFDPANVESNLRERISAFSNTQKAGEKFEYSDADRAVFLHYLELESFAMSMTAIKTKTNLDTTRSTTFFDAQNKLELLQELKTDGKFPSWMVNKLVGDTKTGEKGQSPISSFNIQGFQVELWKDLFKQRNDATVNSFIMDTMRNKQGSFASDVENSFGNSETFINRFRNDLVSFIFQNNVHDFDLNGMKSYKDLSINASHDVKDVTKLAHGVFVKDGIFFVDKAALKNNYLDLQNNNQIGGINKAMFKNANSYYAFIFERELIRSQYSGQAGWSLLQERTDVIKKLEELAKSQARQENETDEMFSSRINRIAYEETIRDIALDNTNNTWKLFKSFNSKADQLTAIQKLYPDLALNYPVVANMAASVLKGSSGSNRMSNIMLSDMMMDADKINIYYQNIKELSDPAKIKIDTMSHQEKLRVTKFFESLSTYAFLQSGLTSTGPFSLIRLVPQEKFTSLMTDFTKNFGDTINPLTLQRYYNEFVRVNGAGQKKRRTRFRDYTITAFNMAADKKAAAGKSLGEIKLLAREGIREEVVSSTDTFKYFGSFYKITVVNGKGVDIQDVGKHTNKTKILDFYNIDKNVDPQNGKSFRNDDTEKLVEVGVATTKEVVVPKGSNPNNLPIFETKDKVFLMNDGQQAAYTNIKSFVMSRLNKPQESKEPLILTSPMTKEFSGVIPQSMWNNMIGLVGRGGVGKTTVIKKVLEDIQKEVRAASKYANVDITYAAPTHNAVTMLQEALGLDSERTGGVQTLSSLVARNQMFSSKERVMDDTGANKPGDLFLLNKEKYEERLKYGKPISEADIIVIDEASMVDGQFIKDLMFRFSSEKGNKMPIFIYMGDYRQLPPVVTGNTDPKIFREGIISATLFSENNPDKFSELTQVMRTDNEMFHAIFDTVGNQITEQRKDVENGGQAKNFDFNTYDAKTDKSTPNMLVVNEKQVDAMIDDYVSVLANTNDPYEMFWTHYNNISNPKTQELFNKIRTAYFKKIGIEMPIGEYKGTGSGTRYEIGVGDFVQSTFTLPVETKSDKVLKIDAGIIKPTARFKVLDIIEGNTSLSNLNSTLFQILRKNIEIPVKKIILYNRQGHKRLVSFPSKPNSITIKGYDAKLKAQVLNITDKDGVVHEIAMPYYKWKEVQNEVMQLNLSFEDMFLPSYIGSTHTVQGASIKKIIVGDYNIRLNAAVPSIAMRDIESSLYTALTRTAEKLIIIKPNSVLIEDNQDVFQLTSAPKSEAVKAEPVPNSIPKVSESTKIPEKIVSSSSPVAENDVSDVSDDEVREALSFCFK